MRSCTPVEASAAAETIPAVTEQVCTELPNTEARAAEDREAQASGGRLVERHAWPTQDRETGVSSTHPAVFAEAQFRTAAAGHAAEDGTLCGERAATLGGTGPGRSGRCGAAASRRTGPFAAALMAVGAHGHAEVLLLGGLHLGVAPRGRCPAMHMCLRCHGHNCGRAIAGVWIVDIMGRMAGVNIGAGHRDGQLSAYTGRPG